MTTPKPDAPQLGTCDALTGHSDPPIKHEHPKEPGCLNWKPLPQVPAHGVFIRKEDVAELHEHAAQMAEDDRRCLLEDALVVELDGFNPWTHGKYPIAMETLADKLIDERMKAERTSALAPAEVPRMPTVKEIAMHLREMVPFAGSDLEAQTWQTAAECVEVFGASPQPGKESDNVKQR